MELWAHQKRGLSMLYPELTPGNSICVTAPTGGGKSKMITEVLKLGVRQTLYTGRKMLLEQLAEGLTAAGVKFGVRAAGYPTDHWQPIQIASIQTEDARVIKSGAWELHPSDVVHVDEAHSHREAVACELIKRHLDRGATIVGWTATPLGIGHIYQKLIVAGTTSELRECGALVPAHHYGPDEPDMKSVKRTKTGEYKQADIVKAIMTHSIFGRVVEHWRRLNPEMQPTLLFAPGVPESIWFAEKLTAEGISAAHIDGDDVWIAGKFYKADQEARDELKRLSASGEVKIVCNRFVMREGVDWTHLTHGIFATLFGALTGYLQSGGRLLRQHYVDGVPQLEHVIIQDHGGNWWRHGSLNSDREWHLDRTDYQVSQVREERLRSKQEREPICCPKCFALRMAGPTCNECGYAHHVRSRMVVQQNGTLKEMKGDIFKPRRTDDRPNAAQRWKQCYFRCRKSGMNFNQARGLYAYENNYRYPPAGLPLMPRDELDWFREIKSVPYDRLFADNEGPGPLFKPPSDPFLDAMAAFSEGS